MQPQPFLEKRLVFKPAKLPPGPRPNHAGAVQGVPNPQIQAIQAQTQGDNFYLQLVGDVNITKTSKEQGRGTGNGAIGGNGRTQDRVSLTGQWRQKPIRSSLMLKLHSQNPLNPSPEPTITDEKTEDQQSGSESWTLQFRDLPEVAGRRPVTSRLIYDLELKDGDPLAFMSDLEYTYIPPPLFPFVVPLSKLLDPLLKF